ncbi:hypothetical protein ACFQ6S_24975 [Streptomyces sp. NPDC056479]|uniref:hypothetical protein n=1 Tax=Streptomyces sp. NPDC056479 TaxID=3345832 RepID=UPI0036A1BC6A
MSLALQLANVAILAITLLLTVRLARATAAQAIATQRQVELTTVVQSRPLLSVQRIKLVWGPSSHLREIQFSVSNSGQGSCFNLETRISALGRAWFVQWATDSDDEAYGAIRPGDSRKFVATAVDGLGARENFQNDMSIVIECFDVMAVQYEFTHSFKISANVSHVRDVGMNVKVKSS